MSDIYWYSLADGSFGTCKACEFIIIDVDKLTPEQEQHIYEADVDGDEQELRDALVGIMYAQTGRLARGRRGTINARGTVGCPSRGSR
jgi:hypothetical protein